jgi:dTDP-4-dehydrorhamnose reductase
MKKVVLVGQGGQLGYELAKFRPADIEIVELSEKELDITDKVSVISRMSKLQPEVIINCAAYTNVDKAESEPDKAFAVNETGSENLALAATRTNSLLIHISTDFVFDGCSGKPYLPSSQVNPVGVYGKSKLAGEKKILASGCEALIIRTSWLYSAFGNNFVKTMLRLMKEKETLGVVVDQIGTPTWAGSLAEFVWQMTGSSYRGILHWSDAGVASWYDFAVAIVEESVKLGLLDKMTEIRSIRTDQYPTPAKRPHFSVLDKSLSYEMFRGKICHWRKNLVGCLAELKHEAI